MLFVDSGDLDHDRLAALYNSTPIENLPNIACWLQEGTVLYARIGKNGLGERMPLNYILSPSLDSRPGEDYAWTMMKWGFHDERRLGSHLAALIAILAQHMEHSILEPPNIQREIIFLEPSSYQIFK